jgi:hypothetical protein
MIIIGFPPIGRRCGEPSPWQNARKNPKRFGKDSLQSAFGQRFDAVHAIVALATE